MSKQPCVYLLASKRNGTLYVGVTSDLVKRIWQHVARKQRSGIRDFYVPSFPDSIALHPGYAGWYEVHETMESAIGREKAIKEWQRAWKLKLIEALNPDWKDLYDTIC